MNTKEYKIAITGAAGQIGYALSFLLPSIMSQYSIKLSLIDLPDTKQKLKGLMYELQDANLFNVKDINIHTDLDSLGEADFVILLGAAPRTKNMQRKDLLKLNGGIFKEVGLKLRNTKNNPKVLVVGNPCNTNALVAMHHSDLSHSNFFAMTALDEMRAKSLIAQKLNSNLKDINDVYIYGNHSNTMVPDLSQASINNNLIINMLSKKWIDESFIPMVKSRGASIIEHRQASSAASAAMAVINSIIAIVEKKSISIACSKANPFSINSELIYSYPINFETEIGAVKKINLNQETLNLMKISEQELLLERDLVCELNLL